MDNAKGSIRDNIQVGMDKFIKIAISIILTSFYLFPFEFKFLPGINTKMAMAAVGGGLLILHLAHKRMANIDRSFLEIVIYGALISFVAFISYTYNNTIDYSFVRYPVSIFVWMAGAYCLCQWIKKVHGVVSVELLGRYMIVVCLLQCILALSIDRLPMLKAFVNSFLGGEELYMSAVEGRLYGIGCALDVAGGRFAAILVIIACLSTRKQTLSRPLWVTFYIMSALVIIIIGNMVGRTTTVGMVLAIVYWIYMYFRGDKRGQFSKYLFVVALCSLPFIIYLYKTDLVIQDYLRFGFEGFFSLVEQGKWDVGSNNILREYMIVFPDNLKTWLIGDAYAMNPSEYDPLYIGPVFKGFYMNTDVGYLRFIFYFGIIGCITMVLFISKISAICIERFPEYRVMFLMLLVVNLVIWLKVTTDIFLVFAPYLCISAIDNDEYEKQSQVNSIETTNAEIGALDAGE